MNSSLYGSGEGGRHCAKSAQHDKKEQRAKDVEPCAAFCATSAYDICTAVAKVLKKARAVINDTQTGTVPKFLNLQKQE